MIKTKLNLNSLQLDHNLNLKKHIIININYKNAFSLNCFLHYFNLQFTLFHTVPSSCFADIFDQKRRPELSLWRSLIVAAALTIVEGSWPWPLSLESYPSVEWSWGARISGNDLLKIQTGFGNQGDLIHRYINWVW